MDWIYTRVYVKCIRVNSLVGVDFARVPWQNHSISSVSKCRQCTACSCGSCVYLKPSYKKYEMNPGTFWLNVFVVSYCFPIPSNNTHTDTKPFKIDFKFRSGNMISIRHGYAVCVYYFMPGIITFGLDKWERGHSSHTPLHSIAFIFAVC